MAAASASRSLAATARPPTWRWASMRCARPRTDAWVVNAASIYSTDDKLGITSANSLGGLIRYDHNLNAKLFAYGVFTGMYDTLQFLNYRVMPGGGLGYHAIASKTTTLDLLGGLGYTRESYYVGPPNNLFTATLGDEFTHKFTASTSITQNLYYLPSLNDTSNYRINFNVGLATKLNRLADRQHEFQRSVRQPAGAGQQVQRHYLHHWIGLHLRRPSRPSKTSRFCFERSSGVTEASNSPRSRWFLPT